MKNRALATLISSALMAAPLAVMADPGQFFVTPFAGVQDFDSARDAGDNGVWGVGGEYQFSEHFGTELDYVHSLDNMQAGSPKDDVNYERASLDGIYYFGKMATVWQPYAKLGVGHDWYDYHHAPEDQNTDIDAGLGVRVNVTDHFSWRVEAKAIHEVDDSQTHGLYTFGIGYAFGGAAKAAPVVAAAAVVAAPVDSDGDGVYDDKDKCPNTPRGLEVDADGCELHLKETAEIRIDIKFETNKADISEAYVGEVERVSKFLHKYSSVNAEIGGHTDSVGSDAFNQKLSQRRADAVKAMLVTRFGIDAARLTAVGYGESKPIASNATAEGRGENRRVVAVMQAETTQAVKKQ